MPRTNTQPADRPRHRLPPVDSHVPPTRAMRRARMKIALLVLAACAVFGLARPGLWRTDPVAPAVVVALRDGVVIGEGLTLRATPDGAPLGATLEPGTPLQQLAVADGWRQVRLENGQRGWLPHDAVFVAEGDTP